MQKYSVLSFCWFNFRNPFSPELSAEQSWQCFLDGTSLLDLCGSCRVAVCGVTQAERQRPWGWGQAGG